MTAEVPSGARQGRGGIQLQGWCAALALALAALALRLYRLGAQCLWYDEAQTLFVARFPWAEIVQRTYRPPLYHLLLHIWSALVPEAEWWLRLPSALLGAAVPPLLYCLGRRLYGERVGLAAGLLAAVSPTLIAYAQELRMYSLMAAEFALLLGLLAPVWLERAPVGLGRWAAIGLVIIASLYTHYFAIPFLLCTAALLALTLAAQRRWRVLGEWVALLAACAVAFVPWLLVIRAGRGGTEDYVAAEVLPVLPDVPGVRAFLQRTWLFYSTGPVTSELMLVRHWAWLAALLVGLVLLLWVATLVAEAHRRWRTGQEPLSPSRLADLWLLALVLVPLAGAGVMYRLRPGVVHPRHLMMLAVPLLLWVARATEPAWSLASAWRTHRVSGLAAGLLGGLTLLALAGLSTLSQWQAWRDPALQRADVREMARQVALRSDAHTVVLLPHRDYAFEHYFQDAATLYHIETRVGDRDLLPWLVPRMHGAQRAILIEWIHLHQDPRDLLPWFLQRNGHLVERFWSAERWVSVYALEARVGVPSWTPLDVRADPLRLRALSLPDASPADQLLAIGLEWQLERPTSRDLKVSVRLVDADGHVLAADDRVLLAEQATVPTSRWRAGVEARNYYLLQPPVGTPPVVHTIQVAVYDAEGPLPFTAVDGTPLGMLLNLGSVKLAPPAAFPASFPAEMPMRRLGSELAPGLVLEGFAVEREALRAGETLPVTLYWRALRGGLPAYEIGVTLLSTEGVTIGAQRGHAVQGRYPTNLWHAGELVADRRQLRVDPLAESGDGRVILTVGDATIVLGGVEIEASDRLYSLPPVKYPLDVTLGGVARLAGLDLSSESLRAGEPVALTLYWEALPGANLAQDYVVFVHLISPDERILAQHDGPPAAGTWPTTAWAPGQIIVDAHTLTWRVSDYTGPATLVVGLYDPATWQRLRTPEGLDRIVVPVPVSVH